MKDLYLYGMRLRGHSPGAQPRDYLYERRDDTTGKYYDILAYTRKLSEYALLHYDLDYLGEERSAPCKP